MAPWLLLPCMALVWSRLRYCRDAASRTDEPKPKDGWLFLPARVCSPKPDRRLERPPCGWLGEERGGEEGGGRRSSRPHSGLNIAAPKGGREGAESAKERVM